MKKHRAILMWACTVSAVLLGVLYLFTCWWSFHYYRECDFSVDAGAVMVRWTQPPASGHIAFQVFYGMHACPRETPFIWWPSHDSFAQLHLLRVPIWIPLVAIAIPTFFLWRSHLRARRAARIHLCPTCNYAVAGLPAGAPCPECGGRPEA